MAAAEQTSRGIPDVHQHVAESTRLQWLQQQLYLIGHSKTQATLADCGDLYNPTFPTLLETIAKMMHNHVPFMGMLAMSLEFDFLLKGVGFDISFKEQFDFVKPEVKGRTQFLDIEVGPHVSETFLLVKGRRMDATQRLALTIKNEVPTETVVNNFDTYAICLGYNEDVKLPPQIAAFHAMIYSLQMNKFRFYHTEILVAPETDRLTLYAFANKAHLALEIVMDLPILIERCDSLRERARVVYEAAR